MSDDPRLPALVAVPRYIGELHVATGLPPRLIEGACMLSNHAHVRASGGTAMEYEACLRSPATCYLNAGHTGDHVFVPNR